MRINESLDILHKVLDIFKTQWTRYNVTHFVFLTITIEYLGYEIEHNVTLENRLRKQL